MKVIASEVVGGQTITPRAGRFMARGVLYSDKDYRELNNGEPKPRAAFTVGDDEHRVDFDTEVYVGFSVFLPRNFESETGTNGDQGSVVLYSMNTDSRATFLDLRVFVPRSGSGPHWFLNYTVNADSVEEAGSETVDLGPITPDIGLWTDFVLRLRSNPFSVTTNPARAGILNANDQSYEGNRGILQMWKAEGAVDVNGDRSMVRKVSVVDAPVGNVPGTTEGESRLNLRLNVYKYSWQRLTTTSVAGPVWVGFDEFRYGEAVLDGTRYSDVHPAGLECTDGCSATQVVRPLPPRQLVMQ
jgi:hypothetical protein